MGCAANPAVQPEETTMTNANTDTTAMTEVDLETMGQQMFRLLDLIQWDDAFSAEELSMSA
jgi:hypothetical protein